MDKKRIVNSNKNIIHLCRVVKHNIKDELTAYKYSDMFHHVIILNSLQQQLTRRM